MFEGRRLTAAPANLQDLPLGVSSLEHEAGSEEQNETELYLYCMRCTKYRSECEFFRECEPVRTHLGVLRTSHVHMRSVC